MKTSLRSIFFLLVIGLPMSAAAQDKADAKKADADATAKKADGDTKEEEKEEAPKKWGVSAGISNTIGQGTFVSLAEDSDLELRNTGDTSNAYDRVRMGYRIGASYNLDEWVPLSVSAGWGFGHWLSAGGGSITPNEFRISNPSARVSWSGYQIPGIDARVSAGAGFVFPVSKAARVSTLILGTSANIGLSKTFFDALSLSIGVNGGKSFHSSEGPQLDIDDLGVTCVDTFQNSCTENLIFRDDERLGDNTVLIDGVNGEYNLGFSASAGFPIIEKLSGSVSYSISTFWTYSQENDDQFTPDVEGINTGRGVGQSTSTSIGLSYPVLSNWNGISVGASAGLYTGSAPKTSDNKSFRFPFWNFEGAAANRSGISLGLSARY